jgi:hypothetical protein
MLYRSTMLPAVGAHIGGTVHNEAGFSFGAPALWFLWLSFTIGIIGAGILVVYFAGERLEAVTDSLGSNWGGTVIAALAIVVGLPLAAILSFMTGVGFVFGLFLMFVMIPMVAFSGYVIAGTTIGRLILGTRGETPAKMYTAALVGILAMQVTALIPGIGVLAVFIATQLGAGALVYRRWNMHRTARIPSPLIVQPA